VSDIVITGVEQLAALGVRLKVAGAKDLRRELLAGLRVAAKPLVADARAAATAQLPKRGGLNARVAKDPILIRNRLTGSGVGVRIVTTTSDTRGANRGTWRHPVFKTGAWVEQTYAPAKGWFDDTLTKAAPAARVQILAAMESVALKITKL